MARTDELYSDRSIVDAGMTRAEVDALYQEWREQLAATWAGEEDKSDLDAVLAEPPGSPLTLLMRVESYRLERAADELLAAEEEGVDEDDGDSDPGEVSDDTWCLITTALLERLPPEVREAVLTDPELSTEDRASIFQADARGRFLRAERVAEAAREAAAGVEAGAEAPAAGADADEL